MNRPNPTPPMPFERAEIAQALFDAIRQKAPNGEYLAVRIQGETLWDIVAPRSQDAMLEAIRTTNNRDPA